VKYGRIIAFGRALPRIRRRVDRDLRRAGLPRERVLAAVVRLLEKTGMRVGNEEYARENNSFGLTTLRDRHARVGTKRIRFRFRGKGGTTRDLELSDVRLARVVSRCQDLPGQELFAYLDEEAQVRIIGSSDVNDYLREISGQAFTAKDFRTWAGTVLAAQALAELDPADSPTSGRRNVARAVEQVAAWLRNTPAVSRRAYVHPAVIDAYLAGDTVESAGLAASGQGRSPLPNLAPYEPQVLALLRRRAAGTTRGVGQAAPSRRRARR
jgi:DNA topoisomerase-1